MARNQRYKGLLSTSSVTWAVTAVVTGVAIAKC